MNNLQKAIFKHILTKKRSEPMNKKSKFNIEPYLFIGPTVLLFIFVLALPLINVIWFSLGDSNIIQGFKAWNGFENFSYLAGGRFIKSLGVTFVYVVFGVAGIVVFGLLASLALNKPMPFVGVFRSIAIIPWIVPHAFAASMWSWVLNSQFGFLNQLLMKLRLISEPISFLSDGTALPTVIMVRIWQGTPFMIISLLAALQTIPSDIDEAADLDGASLWQKFRYITLPYLKPVLLTSTLIVTAWTIQIFDTVYIMTGGGPARQTQLVALEIYNKAFLDYDLGTASAIALVVLVVVGAIGFFKFKMEKGVED